MPRSDPIVDPRRDVDLNAICAYAILERMTSEGVAVNDASIDLASLDARRLGWDQIYLDPNNPRLAGISEGLRISDDAIANPELQDDLTTKLRQVGIQDVVDKIKQLGYLPIDRIVVRPIVGTPDKFVVLEGNRRIAALRSVRGNPVVAATLKPAVRESLDEIDVLVYEGADEDIAWLIQGVRHIDSVKEWGPFQQARFLVDLQERRQIPVTELAAVAGVGRTRVSRLVRSYAGWIQASQDSDYGDKIDENDFSVFLEAIFHRNQSPLWVWLEWDDVARQFASEANLKTMLELLKDAEDGPIRIQRVNPDLRDKFSKLVAPGNEAALESLVSRSKDLDQALAEVSKDEGRLELLDLGGQRSRLQELFDRLETLPLPKIVNSDDRDDFLEILSKIAIAARQQHAFLSTTPVGDE